MKSDVEIARAAKMRPIAEIAGTLGIAAEQIESYGRYKAKLTAEALAGRTKKNGKLILVTAINPTPAGGGRQRRASASPTHSTGRARRRLLLCVSRRSARASA